MKYHYHISPTIDFHVHLFPDRMFEAIWRYFSKYYKWEVIYRYYHQQCIDFLRENGVEIIIYSNYAHKSGIAENLNKWNLKVLEENDDIYCFAAFHPDDPNALKQATELLQHPKILGFKLHHLVQEIYPHDERLFPLYELVIEQRARILFHVGTGPGSNQYVGFKHFQKVMERYPELPANAAHLGGFEYREFMESLSKYPNLYLDTSFAFLPRLGGMFDLPVEALERNKDRIVYGSDFPNLIYPREEEIDVLRKLELSSEFYRKIFSTNGLDLLGRKV